jgi:hypothetical protein
MWCVPSCHVYLSTYICTLKYNLQKALCILVLLPLILPTLPVAYICGFVFHIRSQDISFFVCLSGGLFQSGQRLFKTVTRIRHRPRGKVYPPPGHFTFTKFSAGALLASTDLYGPHDWPLSCLYTYCIVRSCRIVLSCRPLSGPCLISNSLTSKHHLQAS